MEAITRLEKSGVALPQIAAAAGVSPAAVRRWKRHECAPNGTTRSRLVEFAAQRGIVLLATDFSVRSA